MAKRKVYGKVIDTGATLERVTTREIEDALGAEAYGGGVSGGSPFSVWALRSRLMSELVSTGGRPGRSDASPRKVSMTDAEWSALDKVTDLLKRQGVSATPGQVAGLLLHQSLAEVLKRLEDEAPAKTAESRSSARRTVNSIEDTLDNVLAAVANAQVHLEQLRPVALELLKRMRKTRTART